MLLLCNAGKEWTDTLLTEGTVLTLKSEEYGTTKVTLGTRDAHSGLFAVTYADGGPDHLPLDSYFKVRSVGPGQPVQVPTYTHHPCTGTHPIIRNPLNKKSTRHSGPRIAANSFEYQRIGEITSRYPGPYPL